MSYIGSPMMSMIEELTALRNRAILKDLSDNVFEHILYQGVTSEHSYGAGTYYNGIYFNEHEIANEYFDRYQDAEPLF